MFKRSSEKNTLRSGIDSSSDDDDKQRGTLVLSGRGVSNRLRHLHSDMLSLIPHSKKDQKVDTRKDIRLLKELAELSSCAHIVLLESRNECDYLWLSSHVNGPTIRLGMTSFSTLEELGLLGNFFKNTRFVLSTSVHESTESALLIQVLCGIFNSSDNSSSDKIISLYEHSGILYLRFFHVNGGESALEVGPRMELCIDLIMKNCFSGEIIFKKQNLA